MPRTEELAIRHSLDRMVLTPEGDIRLRKRTTGGKIITPFVNGRGQRRIKLPLPDGGYANVLLHRVVYYYFTRDDDMWGSDVVHLDGDPANNHITNLRLRGKDVTPVIDALYDQVYLPKPPDIFGEELSEAASRALSSEDKFKVLARMMEKLS